MIIIGEKINGAIPKTAEAIKNRDEAYIIALARAQDEAGADYLDVCAGTSTDLEYEALVWLIGLVQEASEKPICIDSPDPFMLERVFPLIKRPGIINSISGEGRKCEVLLPILKDCPDWQVVALCCGQSGVAASADEKVRIAADLVEEAGKYGVSAERIHIDPLVLALPAVNDSALMFCEAIRRVKESFPGIKTAAALSNISFGMPCRALINKNFLTMSMLAGLDTLIADPTSRDITETLYATEALLGRDRLCRRYNKAFRAGLIGKKK